ncbi:site-specific tyrosine recombinase XerD [Phocaeicola vulgatus]|nr:site-specific tyrosine recombinase XerD [Phocaeicola vulgatus]KAB6589126.1 site-specific tyrosine recombinase XerD [Phocaeicola vulgatus]KAB6593845.1 site-specific tyrosine recombinase XerD [Phocaeicola vulgatus]
MKRTEKTDKILVKYKQYLKLEKSLSDNTVDAYLTDLDKLLAYLTLENINILDVRLENLEDFSAGLHDIGIHPRSQARILSGIRSFYRFLIMEDYLKADPTELLESPQTGFKLPEVMTVEEIDLLIGSIDRSTKEGQRNRAILETLYSCGLRVSELCNLKLSELYFEEGFIKVEGKGSKQRLVPISPRAIKEIRLYFTDRNLMKIKPGFEDFVFISNFGKNISRIMVFHIIKELAAQIGLKKKISPHTFRHSFATHLLEGGANLRAIQCMLGHESIGTTEIYTHIDRNMLRSEIIEHHPRNIKFREKDNKGSIF